MPGARIVGTGEGGAAGTQGITGTPHGTPKINSACTKGRSRRGAPTRGGSATASRGGAPASRAISRRSGGKRHAFGGGGAGSKGWRQRTSWRESPRGGRQRGGTTGETRPTSHATPPDTPTPRRRGDPTARGTADAPAGRRNQERTNGAAGGGPAARAKTGRSRPGGQRAAHEPIRQGHGGTQGRPG